MCAETVRVAVATAATLRRLVVEADSESAVASARRSGCRSARRPARARRCAPFPTHIWPPCEKEPLQAPAAARSTSTSSRTIIAFLPPSSSEQPIRRSAHCAAHHPADAGRTREHGEVDPLDQRWTELRPAPGHQLEYVGRKAGCVQQRRRPESGVRRVRIELDHGRAAGDECRQGVRDAEDEREVPGRDDPDDADGFVVLPGLRQQGQSASLPPRSEERGRCAPVVPRDVRRLEDLLEGVLAGLSPLELNQVESNVPVIEEEIVEAQEDLGSRPQRPPSPGGLGDAGAANRLADVLRIHARHFTEALARCGSRDRDRRTLPGSGGETLCQQLEPRRVDPGGQPPRRFGRSDRHNKRELNFRWPRERQPYDQPADYPPSDDCRRLHQDVLRHESGHRRGDRARCRGTASTETRRAIAAAEEAQPAWRARTAQERAKVLRRWSI